MIKSKTNREQLHIKVRNQNIRSITTTNNNKNKHQHAYLCFCNHLIDITLELVDPKSLSEEPELLLSHRVVNIKDHPRSKSWHIELVHLLLAEISLLSLEEVCRDLRPNEEGDVLVEELEGEDPPKLRVLLPEHKDWTFQESDKPSNQGPPLHHWGHPLLGFGHYKG